MATTNYGNPCLCTSCKGRAQESRGSYFVTVVTKDRQPLFGEVVDGEMQLNEYGRIVEEEWQRSAAIRNEIELDEYVVMPNHFHAIVHIIPTTDSAGKLISSTGPAAGRPNDKKRGFG